ncbi:MAG: DUF2723 domain-containing protein [Candidatus Promineofilum sp.]|nr:DUF2723 domain-containing protein [Promineifilum sp.]
MHHRLNSLPINSLIRYAPGLVLGLFLSRVLGEWFGLPGLGAAAGLALLLGVGGAWALARRPSAQTWPALILIAYVAYPQLDLQWAARVAAVTLVAFLWAAFNYHREASTGTPSIRAGQAAVWLPAIGLAVAFFFLYVLTLAPDVLAADGGELQIVAAQLGVAHPPGFPLYVIAAHLFTRLLPFVSPAYAVNLFSAVAGALAVGVVYVTAALITRKPLPGLIAAVALGSATTFWSQATTANVRSLTALFAALILGVLVWYRAAAEAKDRRAADRRLTLAALFMGFGLTHHISLMFLASVGLIFVLMVEPGLIRSPRRWVRPLMAGALGLLPLLYLPLRAGADVRGALPSLATWSGFLEHALATGFRGDLFYFTSPADFWQRLRVMGNVMSFQFSILLLVIMLIGLLLVIKRDRPLAVLLGGSFAIFTVVAATYRAPQTVEYMIPAYVAAVLLLAYGLAASAEFLSRLGRPGSVLTTLLTAVAAVAAIGQIVDSQSASGLTHEGTSARDYAGTLLAAAPAGSVILSHWHWATPLWYLQEVEGQRPDVEVQFVFPEGESYEATWERRTREAFAAGRPVITTWIPPVSQEGLPVPEPIGEAMLFPQDTRIDLPDSFVESDLMLGDAVAVVGYQLATPDGVAAGEEGVVTIAWRPVAELLPDMGLFVHLVGPDGVLYGQDDRPAVAAEGITLTQFRATLRPGTPLGRISIFIGVSGPITGRQALAELAVRPSFTAPYTRHRVERKPVAESAAVLIGYDWDHTLADRSRLYLHWRLADGYTTQVYDDLAAADLTLPPYRGAWGVPVRAWRFPRGEQSGHYVPLGQGIVWTGETLNGLALSPGDSIVVDQEFHSARPINRDYVVSVRLIGLEPDGIHWAWWDLQDSIPAMGAIPTLKWVSGSFVRSPHRVRVAESALPGQTLTGALTLYDAFTNRPLAILDERITADNPWIPLCRAVVQAAEQ